MPTRGGLDIYREVAQAFTESVERMSEEQREMRVDMRALSAKVEDMRASELRELSERLVRLESDLKHKAGLWGALAGLLPALAALAVLYLSRAL